MWRIEMKQKKPKFTIRSLAKEMGSTILKGKYNTEAYCTNCQKKSLISIERGTSVEEYFKKGGKCPHCGCNSLEKAKEDGRRSKFKHIK
jgi:hypothetical protein